MGPPLSGCGENGISFMFSFGTAAAHRREWFFWIVGIVSIVVLPTFVLVPGSAWRYRRTNNKAAYRPDWAFFWSPSIAPQS